MRGLTRLLLACLALLALAAPASAGPRPFELRDGQVVITVTVNGREIPALLDTGATDTMIEYDLAKELGISSSWGGGGGTVGASGRRIGYGFTEKVVLDIGAGPARRQINTYPAGNTFAAEGVRFLVGMDFLNAMALSLDFETMTLDMQRSSSFKAPKEQPLALTRKNTGWRRHVLLVDIGGTQAELLLDTAASGALHLDASFVAKTSALNALPVSTRSIAGIDGVHPQAALIVPRVKLGESVFENVRASSSSLGMLRRFDESDGLVGVDLMKRFNWVIDFGGQRVWMTPNANHDAPFR